MAKTRSGRPRSFAFAARVLAVGTVVLVGLGVGSLPGRAASTTPRLPGLQTDAAPWPPELAHLHARLEADGLPTHDGDAVHIHQHLVVLVHGRSVVVPPDIGIDRRTRLIAPLHTHDASGLIHVESPVAREFTLGEFFDVWGVRFSPTCLGAYCDDAEATLRIFVNGKRELADPRDLVLAPHQEIVVSFGRESELPNPIPSSYNFGPNE